MKPSGSDGTSSAQCLRPRSGSDVFGSYALFSRWQWHVDEVFVKVNGERHYLWRAVDHEREVLESYFTKRRDRNASLVFLKKAMKRYGKPEAIVTDRLRSYGAAIRTIGNCAKQETGRWLNNRAKNSHLPFRRRERAMSRFRQSRSSQKFAAVHSSVFNHFKLNSTAALSDWRCLCAA